MTEQEHGITQPVTVNPISPAEPPTEATEPTEVTPEARQAQLPEWLLKFASSPEQAADETQPADELDFQAPFPGDLEEDEDFTPPEIPGEYEWQEIAEFQDQEELELEPVLEAPEIIAEDQVVKASESDLEVNLDEVAGTPPVVDPQVKSADNFKLEVGSLLKHGQREEALALIRENKADPVLAEAAKKTLRSQLTLASDANDLWDVYDELHSPSN